MSELKSPYHFWNVLEGKDQVDFYDILNLLESNGTKIPHEIAHALKKQMMMGERGHKGLVKDLREAVGSIERFLENIGTVDEEEHCNQEILEEVIESFEELEVETPESTFRLKLNSAAEHASICFTRSYEEVYVLHEIFEGKLKVFPHNGKGLELDNLLCKVDAKTFRVNTATDIDSPHDLMYNELPTFTEEGE